MYISIEFESMNHKKSLVLFFALLWVACAPQKEQEQTKVQEVTLENALVQHANGNQTAYTKGGTGKALVFIHAGGLNKEMWTEQLKVFGASHTVIAFDIRAHGASAAVDNLEFDWVDLLAILEQEQIDKIDLVGCSLGSIIALDLAINHPEKIDKLVLASPGLVGYQEKDPEYGRQIQGFVRAFQKQKPDSMLYQLKVMNAYGTREGLASQQVESYLDSALKRFIMSRGLIRKTALSSYKHQEVMGTVKSPTLILVGDADHGYIRKSAELIEAGLENASLEVIKNAGHLLNLEQPEAFNRALKQFLSK